MSLLLLFAGDGGTPSAPLDELVLTEPAATFGYPIQRPADEGEWRWVVELLNPADVAATWIDVTKFYAGDRHQFGADQPFGDARARLVTVQLQIDNVQADTLGVPGDILAPWGHDTTDVFGVDIPLDAGLIMRAGLIRVVESVTVEWNPIWTGRVESWGDESESRGQIRRHVVSVVDTFSDLANVPTIIESSPSTWDAWFEELFTAAGWPFGADLYGDFSDAGLPQDLNMVAAINRMDQGTDPLGLVWRSLRTGRLVVHPAPWDTTNTDRYPNPLLDVYPDGLVFSYSPDFTDIEYIADDGQQPFGIWRNIAGVLNYFVVTMPDDEVYAIDDPVSAARYGIRPFQATWILSNPPVVDDLMTARAYASAEALPLRTTLDHEGFWSAMAIVDHLDPVTIIHATGGGLVVTATGMVRNVVEERTMRFYDGDAVGALSWQSTVQFDLDATETSEALLPVEDLALVSTFTPGFGGPSGAEFSWTNPTQPSITPTEVQIRVLGRSLIWSSEDYPGVGADGTTVNWLSAATPYTFQVRLVRRVNGVITASSPIRELDFTTPAVILPVPVPGDDPTDTNVDMDDLPFDECEDDVSIELQEQEEIGGAWVTVDTFSGAEIELVDGSWRLVDDIPNSFFNEGSMYRFLGYCGDELIVTGTAFDPPDDWTDPCTTPPALATAPYNDASLLVYVPQVCAPDIIREAVSGLEAAKGDALKEIGALVTDPNQRALLAISDPEWSDTPGGILAFGECPQVIGATGDKSISVRVMVAEAEDCVLFECAAMRLTCTATSGGWRASVVVYKTGVTITLPTATELDLDTAYTIGATHELATGDIRIYINGAEDNSVGGSDNVATINTLPIWRVGAPPESWITDCALWDALVDLGTLPISDPLDIAGCELWLDAADTSTITAPAGVTQWDDKSGNARHATPFGLAWRPTTGTRTQNGLNVLDFIPNDGMIIPPFMYALGACTAFVVFKSDGTIPAAGSHLIYEASSAAFQPLYGVRFNATDIEAVYRTDANVLKWVVAGDDADDGNPHWFTFTDTGTAAEISLDGGTPASSGAYTRAATTPTDFSIGMLVGGSGGGDPGVLDGWIAEIIVYDNVLSAANIARVETYLINKWGI